LNEKLNIVEEVMTVSMVFKAVQYTDVELEDVTEEGARDAKIRWLISKKDGAVNFAMRFFELAEGGHSPFHQHPWEHEVFVVKGTCKVVCDGEESTVSQGGAIFVPENSRHNFQNVGEGELQFICVVPIGN
jgi:quercetin dioxygenase-like cupin family protein